MTLLCRETSSETLNIESSSIEIYLNHLFVFALIPGMPKFSFFVIAAGAGLLAFRLMKAAVPAEQAAGEEAPPPSPIETVDSLLPLDLLEIEVGYGLIGLVDMAQGGELLQRIKTLRRQSALEMGFVIPAIHIRDNLQLKPNQYSVILKGAEIARGEGTLAFVIEDGGVVETASKTIPIISSQTAGQANSSWSSDVEIGTTHFVEPSAAPSTPAPSSTISSFSPIPVLRPSLREGPCAWGPRAWLGIAPSFAAS